MRQSSVGHQITQSEEVRGGQPACYRYRVMRKSKGRRKKQGESVMRFLSYKIIRGTCLGFSKELQVIVTCNVLQQRFPTASMCLLVILKRGRKSNSVQSP